MPERTRGRLAGIAKRDGKREPMITLDACEVTAHSGVSGDFRGRPGKRQVTVVSREAWDAACAELGTPMPWTARRANLLVEGLMLGPGLVGRVLRIGVDLALEVTGETAPCERMDEACSGLRQALSSDWRGGVTCRVTAAGRIRVGDPVITD